MSTLAAPSPLRGGLLRPLWRRLLWLRFLLFQRHRHNRLVVEEVEGVPIVVLPQVFNPKLFRSGEILARWAARVARPGSAVLDLGTGSGVGAVFAGRRGARVLAVDVNAEAVRCTRINALLHALETRIDVRQGDLFEPVTGERFDVVLFNPPYYRGAPRDALDRAFRSDDVVERFAAGLAGVLAPDGHALVVLSSDAGPPGVRRIFEGNGLSVEVLEEKRLINETLYAWRVSHLRNG